MIQLAQCASRTQKLITGAAGDAIRSFFTGQASASTKIVGMRHRLCEQMPSRPAADRRATQQLRGDEFDRLPVPGLIEHVLGFGEQSPLQPIRLTDRKSTRLNSSHRL